MSETENLQAIEPGGTAESPRLEKLLGGKVDIILDEIEGLTLDELRQIETLEQAGKGRTTLLGAFTREIARRELEAAESNQVEGASAEPPSGTDFRHLSAAEVNPMTLQRPVLTRDGWVCPHPAAMPKE